MTIDQYRPETQRLLEQAYQERISFLEAENAKLAAVVDTAVFAAERREWLQMVTPVVGKNITATGVYKTERADVDLAQKAVIKAEEEHRRALAKWREGLG